MLWSEMERLGRVLEPWRQADGFGRTLGSARRPSGAEFPPTNLWVSENNAVVTTEVPGIDPAALEISVVKNSLTLRGSRQANTPAEGETYHRRERWSGQFTKTLELPFPIEPSRVEARFAKGVLYISMPRAEADKPKKISVKSE